MTQPQTNDGYPIPRATPRAALTGFLPGPLSSEKHEDLTVVLVDVSPVGLGLVIHPDVSVGEILTLRWEPTPGTSQVVGLEVVWCAKIAPLARIRGFEGVMRVGLKVIDESLDLKALFRSCDTLQIEE